MNKKYLAPLLLIIFIVFRFIIPHTLELIPFGGLIFDALFSVIAISFFWEGLSFINLALNPRLMILYFFMGGLIYCLGMYSQFSNPFAFESAQTFLMMIIIGPIIEELLFRLGLWKIIENLPFRFKYDSLIITSVLFSFSHFHAYFFVASEFHSFVIYQTIYTLLLGLCLGYEFHKRRSLTTVTIHHMLFNLGFYTAYFWRYIL